LLNEYDDPTSVAIGFAIIGTAFVGLFVWRCFKDGRDAFLLGLFAGPLAIVLNVLYRTGETFAERFLALPIAGAVLMIVRLAAHRPRLGGSVLFTATCICAVLTARRAGEYRDDEILTAATVRDAPEMSAPLRLLSGVYRRDRAMAQEVIGLAKQDEDARGELAKITSLREGERALVEELLALDYGAERLAKIAEERQLRKKMYDTMRAGIRLNPEDNMLRIDLARELKNEGMPRTASGAFDLLALQEAERHVRHVIERSPAAYEARNLLAEILLARARKLAGDPRAKMLAEAERELRETLRIEPRKDTAGQDLARLLLFHKRTHEAIEFLKRQREVFRDLGERRWWDPRGLQLEASVLRSIAQLQGEPSAGMLTGLPLLFEALERSVSAPWRVRLLQTNLLPTLRELSRSPVSGQRQWLREAADLLESEIADLTARVDGPACLRSDLMSAIAKLELERNNRTAAAHWFERAAKASDLPEVRQNLLRTAAHLWQSHAVVTPPGARIDALRHATRLRRAMYDTR